MATILTKSGIDEEHVVEHNSIVAILPPRLVDSEEAVLLYTEAQTSDAEDKTSSPFSFKCIGISGLDRSLLDQFQPTANCVWIAGPSSVVTVRHVFISTRSGTGRSEAVWRDLVQPLLKRLGHTEDESYHVHTTTSETSMSEYTKEIILPKANNGVSMVILLLSGDGGMVDIVNGLVSAQRSAAFVKPIISLLPLGTGNALANSSGLTSDKTLGLRAALLGGRKDVPLFRVTFSNGVTLVANEGREEQSLDVGGDAPSAYGAVVCSWGHHAALVADSDTVEYRKFGSERFKMAAKEALFPSDGSAPHPYRAKVSIRKLNEEWQELEREEHGYVLATYVSQLEAGFTISPQSKPLDGKLRLVHFGALGGQEAMGVMTKAFQGGKHVEDDRIGYEEIEGLRIEFDEDDGCWRRICVDGKIYRVEEGGWIEVSTNVDSIVELVCREI
jgi:diacylglycerol kinase family enzyme